MLNDYPVETNTTSSNFIQCGQCGQFYWRHEVHLCSSGSCGTKGDDILSATCPWCGEQYTGIHVCGNVLPWDIQQFATDERIAVALERIAAALEKMSE